MHARLCLGAVLAAIALAGCREATGSSTPDLEFTAPIAGAPMTDVFYGAYVDHDPSPGVRDYECGGKSYDGHRGVDVLLRSFREQDAGVQVLAAAEGVVASVADGLPDRNTSWEVGGGFGNHVVVSHPGGFSTIYGHLRRGSVAVAPGARVERGAVLGLVGSSGRSNWPHLHFEVHRDNSVVESFVGACAAGRSLWRDQLAYQDGFAVVDAGTTHEQPSLATLLERPPTLASVPMDVPSFLFWLQLANQPAAVVRQELRGPSGAVLQDVERAVGATFSMRYLLLTVPVNGVLTQPGEWEVRTYQDGVLIWTQPFTLTAAAGAAADARAPVAARALAMDVLDQAPGGHAHP